MGVTTSARPRRHPPRVIFSFSLFLILFTTLRYLFHYIPSSRTSECLALLLSFATQLSYELVTLVSPLYPCIIFYFIRRIIKEVRIFFTRQSHAPIILHQRYTHLLERKIFFHDKKNMNKNIIFRSKQRIPVFVCSLCNFTLF